MNPIERISIKYTGLTKAERTTCDAIIENPTIIVENSIADAAVQYKVSPSSILRMTQKIGYKGYSEFRYDLSNYLENEPDKLNNSSEIVEMKKIIDANIVALQALQHKEYDLKLKELINVIKTKNNLKTIGIGNSALPASQLVYSLYLKHKFGEALIDSVKLDYYKLVDASKDIIIIFSVSGSNDTYSEAVKEIKKNGGTIAVITANQDCDWLEYCDFQFILPSTPFITDNSSKLTYVDNRYLFYIFADIIAHYY